jgi:Zn-dependent peptidase ImmA (M78 family)
MRGTWTEANRIGMYLALREHRRAGTNFSEPVDIFGHIRRNGIILLLQPLKALEGYYLPPPERDGVHGIALNSNHPLSRQRYTGAHEYCHFLRRDAQTLDLLHELPRSQEHFGKANEMVAEAFASWFLMPPQLLEHVAEGLGISLGTGDPKDVYGLSLLVRTSYEATCRHLYNMKRVTRDRMNSLLATRPKATKLDLGYYEGQRDVWKINESHNGQTLNPCVDDFLVVELAEVPSTGFIWHAPESDKLEVVENSFLDQGLKSQFGSAGTRRIVLRPREEGIYPVTLALRRPWESTAAKEIHLKVRCERANRVGLYDPELLWAFAT